MDCIIYKTFTTEELEKEHVKLSRQTFMMLKHSCPTTYLKEMCDYYGCAVNWRDARGYVWCFFRETANSPISLTTRHRISLAAKQCITRRANDKINASYKMILLLSNLAKGYKEFYPGMDWDLRNKQKIVARELAKRMALHPVTAVANIAQKKNCTVTWMFNKTLDEYKCRCLLESSDRMILTTATVPFAVGSKKLSKRLAAEKMLKALNS